jgi:hypothetical protein
MQALVLGNGESRQSLNLSTVNAVTYGCNAIHRDITVDHLICADSRMVIEAIKNPNTAHSIIYTRANWINQFSLNQNVKIVPALPYTGTHRMDDPWHWGSGPYAVLLAAINHDDIGIVGMDLYSKDGLVNNVYKDTDNYLKSDKPKVDPSYWIYQLGKIFECHPSKNFTIYQDPDWKIPNQWIMPNIKVIGIQDCDKVLQYK